jgi:hypothetical protein
MLFGYGWEHFHAAVERIACSQDPLQDRLADAFLNEITSIQERHVTPEVWDRLANMRAELCKIPAPGEASAIIATTLQMSDSEARKWLKEILHLYEEVCREYARHEYVNAGGFGFNAK